MRKKIIKIYWYSKYLTNEEPKLEGEMREKTAKEKKKKKKKQSKDEKTKKKEKKHMTH